ncbi:cobalt transporter ATP-binding subunit [Paenibacillus sp. PK3_47]|uniref:ATP-binding cassette domain-containing protein n=1 Tax=Paenibacillus sp. PK3_47 TaxID=2072642 RepID=UPI00201E2FB8|nr:ATP-binding cassette domain-containing protein [Paenibacillus sp. PK3_47]UQZ32214.1 cobalt transporter ATP-binding subunit [Paenibacillus sp. PK3_47]
MVWELKGVSVNHAGNAALQDISCILEEGRWISVIGQTGAGKSTFVQVLKGLVQVSQGEYLMDQKPVPRDAKGRPKVIDDIGFVFQYPEHQLFETTVGKELAFAPKLKGYSAQQITEAVDSILPQLGLPREILDSVPFQLSGGQKRKVAIASVLIMNPRLLILDEPTAGIDPVSRAQLLRMLQAWQQQNNRTILFISHHMEDVAEYSDEVVVLAEGHLLGHYGADTLFLEQTAVLEQAGLALPETVQLLQLAEALTGQRVNAAGCREQDIFAAVQPILAQGILK